MRAKDTIVPRNETAIFTEDGLIAVAIPKDKEELGDDEIFLVGCAMLWNTREEDKGANEIVEGILDMVYLEAGTDR
jgi:hypothetical protein